MPFDKAALKGNPQAQKEAIIKLLDNNKNNTIEEVLKKTGIIHVDFVALRRDNHNFDQTLLVADQAEDLRILEGVKKDAIAGNDAARRLYFAKVRIPAFVPRFVSWQGVGEAVPLEKHVAGAMIMAGVKAMKEHPERYLELSLSPEQTMSMVGMALAGQGDLVTPAKKAFQAMGIQGRPL